MITWDSVMDLTDQLADRIKTDGYQPSLIVAIARGGFFPALRLAHRLGVKRLAAIGPDAAARVDRRDRALVAEDIPETGRTLLNARERLRVEAAEVRTIAYYHLPSTVTIPDYSLGPVGEVPVWPWEEKS